MIVTMTACVLVPLFVDTVSHAMCRPPRFFMVFGITLFFCYVEGGLGAIIKLFKVPLKSYFSRDDSENCLFEAEPPDGSQKPKTKSGNSPLVDMRCPVITRARLRLICLLPCRRLCAALKRTGSAMCSGTFAITCHSRDLSHCSIACLCASLSVRASLYGPAHAAPPPPPCPCRSSV